MEYDAGTYRRLAVKEYPARTLRETAEGKYWKRFAAPLVAKQVCWRALITRLRSGGVLPRTGAGRRKKTAADGGGVLRLPSAAAQSNRARALNNTPKPSPNNPHPPKIGGVSHIDFCPQQPYHYAVTASTRVMVYDGQTRLLRRTIARFKDKAYGASFREDGKLLVAGGQDGTVQVFDVNSRNVLRQLKGHARAVHAARFAADRTHVLSCGDDVTVRWWDLTAGKQVGVRACGWVV